MSILPPTDLPNWATLDIVDPISGENNALQPPTQEQLYGYARKQFPVRNWYNWLQRNIYQWLAYFKQNDSKSITTIIQGTYGNAYKIASTATPGSLLVVYIQDSSQGNAGDRFSGQCIPYSSSSSDRTVYPMGASSNISISQISNATGMATVNTGGGGSGFTLVSIQYNAS